MSEHLYMCMIILIYDDIPSCVCVANLDEYRIYRSSAVDKYKVCPMCERDYVSFDRCCSQTSFRSRDIRI